MNTLRLTLRFVLRLASPRRWGGVFRPLCLLVVLAGGLWFGASFTTQWWLVGRLAQRLQVASDVEAPQIVYELARREQRAFQALVQAANSPRAAVALSARREIDLRVDRWQRESYLSPGTFNLRSTAIPLARAFAKTSPTLSPSARRWARQVLEQLAELAESQPINERLELIAQCDRALGGLPRDDPAAALADVGAVSLPILLGGDPLEPAVVSTVPNPPPKVETVPKVAALEPRQEPIPRPPVQEEAFEWQRATPLEASSASSSLAKLPEIPPAAEPAQVPAREASLSRPTRLVTESRESAQHLPAPLADDPTEWFRQLAGGNLADQARAQERLHAAGYGQVRRGDALMYLSASTDDRKALVSRVLTSPRLEASAWLELLLADAAPEVRAAAVAAIATSGDEKLLKRAEEVALRDTEPVVADQLPLIRRQLR